MNKTEKGMREIFEIHDQPMRDIINLKNVCQNAILTGKCHFQKKLECLESGNLHTCKRPDDCQVAILEASVSSIQNVRQQGGVFVEVFELR